MFQNIDLSMTNNQKRLKTEPVRTINTVHALLYKNMLMIQIHKFVYLCISIVLHLPPTDTTENEWDLLVG